jgi:hypothetical protein
MTNHIIKRALYLGTFMVFALSILCAQNSGKISGLVKNVETGVPCIDAEGLQFNHVKILLEQGPVFDIDNARNITIEHPAYTAGVSLFMRVAGKESENIRLLDADTKSAMKEFDLGKEVNPKAINRKE